MKRMNGLLLAITFLMATSCQFTKNGNETEIENKIEKIQIKATDPYSCTLISIDCDDFESVFNNDYVDVSITDTATINMFLGQLENLEPLDSGNWSVDTRAKIILYLANDTITICAGVILKYNDKFYDRPEWLLEYINNLTDEFYDAKKQISQ